MRCCLYAAVLGAALFGGTGRAHAQGGSALVPPPNAAPGGRRIIATSEPTGPPAPLAQPSPTPAGDGPPALQPVALRRTPPSAPGGSGNVPPAPAPLVVEKTGPVSASAGVPYRYEIVVRNVSPAPLLQVRLEDGLPTGARFLGAEPRPEPQPGRLLWELGTLEPGAERRFRVEVMPTGEDDVASCATATFSLSSCLRARVLRPVLTVSLTAPDTARAGDAVVFQIQVANTGTAPATGVLLRAQMTPGLQHPQGSVIEGDLGSLAPGETRLVPLTATAAQAGQQINEVSATAAEGARGEARAAVTIGAAGPTLGPARRPDTPGADIIPVRAEVPVREDEIPSLMLEVGDGADPLGVGEENVYEIRVVNQGRSPCRNLRIEAAVPEGLTVTGVEGMAYRMEGAQLLFVPVAAVPARGEVRCRVRVRGVKPGDWRFQVQVLCDQL